MVSRGRNRAGIDLQMKPALGFESKTVTSPKDIRSTYIMGLITREKRGGSTAAGLSNTNGV